MSPFKIAFFTLALLFSSAALNAQTAFAQGTTIITIDEGRILRDSKAGKSIQAGLKTIEDQIKREIEPTSKTIESEGKALDARATGKTREQLAADTSFVSSYQALQKKAAEFGQKRQTVANEYALTERKALVDFNKALEAVLLEVVREKNAQIVMSKSSAVYSVDAIDATAAVISKLDSRTPSIAVSRQRVPAQK